ncbi:hypothetical protein BU14_0058s0068 [Porphyra umbilicalis]|uniref:PH domain-containing protein n=1 Tax=Porphyra umbilicalis TaxID=2786 RepID=A0A1X6PHE8_PORUM|nr:hypothetical protein BU14_0058s0068 [Porphyra umbilicalis]|eukprot:OSX80156.1 hypothetical protein BU14_0058s0068 [Porphyra umbilicalis]
MPSLAAARAADARAHRALTAAAAGGAGAPPLLAAGYLDKRGRRTRSRVRRWFVLAGGELFNARTSTAAPSWRVGLSGARVAACGLTGKLTLVVGGGRLVFYPIGACKAAGAPARRRATAEPGRPRARAPRPPPAAARRAPCATAAARLAPSVRRRRGRARAARTPPAPPRHGPTRDVAGGGRRRRAAAGGGGWPAAGGGGRRHGGGGRTDGRAGRRRRPGPWRRGWCARLWAAGGGGLAAVSAPGA